VATTTQVVADPAVLGIVDHEELSVVHLHPVHQAGVVGGPRTTPAPGFDLHLDPLVGQLRRRFVPSKSSPWKEVSRPKANTSAPRSSTIRANWLICRGR